MIPTPTTTILPALETLRPNRQWVCFNQTKMPFNPATGKAAEADDPSTWGTYEQAVKAQKADPHWLKGIGYETVKEQGLTFGDIDHCVSPAGELTPYARNIVDLMNTYTELSPSGKGLRFIARGVIPSNLGADIKTDGDNRLEMKDHGGYYTITGNHLPGTPTTIEDRQEQLTALYQEKRAQRRQAKEEKRTPTPLTKVTQVNGCTPYGLKALDEESRELATTREGGRNQRLNNAAYSLGQLVSGGELTQNEVERALMSACHSNGLIEEDGDTRVRATLNSGLKSGMQSPRKAPTPQISTSGGGAGITFITTNGLGELPDASIELVLNCLAQAEWGDSLLFAHLFIGKVLYDHIEKEWYLWYKHHWKRDDTGRIKFYVSGKLASVYINTSAKLNEQLAALENLKSTDETIKVDIAKLKKQTGALYQRAVELRHIARCKNILSYASSHEGLGITADQWDTNKWLLAVPNGVIDLKTGTRRDGQPSDYIRTVCPTDWQGLDTPAPRFERFIQEIFEDRLKNEKGEDIGKQQRAELIAFLQRMFGYGITGEVREHIFTVLYGEDGRNGKDTLESALSNALGQASGVVSKDVLLDSGKQHAAGAATPHISDLQGKRIAWASEPEKGARFNIGQVKELSGGGDLSTRAPYEKRFYTFKPTHLLVLLTNHKPHADANDSAFWDRLRLITFNMRYVDNPLPDTNERQKDTTLSDTLALEAAGILAWLVRGCLSWQKMGLATPQFIAQAGKDYRKEEDTLGLFIEECCMTKNARASEKSSRIYGAYSKWCNDGNMKALNSTNFGKLLSKRFQKKQTGEGIFYQGIGLLAQDMQGVKSNEGFAIDPSLPINPHDKPFEDNQTSQGNEGYEGFLQENPNYSIENSYNDLLSNKTLHTLHYLDQEKGVSQHIEPPSGTVNSFSNPSCMTAFEGKQNTPHGKHEATLQDKAGNWWCEDCILQHDLMDIGHERNYRSIEVEDPQNKRHSLKIDLGREAWLTFCKTMGYTAIRSVLRIVEAQS